MEKKTYTRGVIYCQSKDRTLKFREEMNELDDIRNGNTKLKMNCKMLIYTKNIN